MTQQKRILDYLEKQGSISPKEAFNDLGITKLATRISEMKKSGIKFEQHFEEGTNRFGDPVRYMRYRLLK